MHTISYASCIIDLNDNNNNNKYYKCSDEGGYNVDINLKHTQSLKVIINVLA